MTSQTCAAPLASDVLVDYSLGELEAAVEGAVEDHLFSCEHCSRALEAVVQVGRGTAALVADGAVSAAVTATVVQQLIARGAQVRQYRLAPGDTVACTAAPDDAFVAVRLGGPLAGLDDVTLDVDFHDLAPGERHVATVADVPVDVSAQELVLLMPGDVVRAYPRSRWTMQARGHRGGDPVALGPYALDHTPWEQRTGES